MLTQVDGRSYWYVYRRQHGKVRRIYAGCGPAAELAAQEAQAKQARRRQSRQEAQQERERHAAVDTPISDLIEQTNHLVKAALEAAGYHQHQRGAWRRKRHVQDSE